jgi:hypothetical protein
MRGGALNLATTSNVDLFGFDVAVQENPLAGIPKSLSLVGGNGEDPMCHIFKTPGADCASNAYRFLTLI